MRLSESAGRPDALQTLSDIFCFGLANSEPIPIFGFRLKAGRQTKVQNQIVCEAYLNHGSEGSWHCVGS
jgi:hypothetical protein